MLVRKMVVVIRGQHLPMNVADDGDGGRDVHNVGLAHEDFLGLFAYFAEKCLVKELFLEQLLNACVEVEGGHGGGDDDRCLLLLLLLLLLRACSVAPGVCACLADQCYSYRLALASTSYYWMKGIAQ
jgi:hypothetical protein